MTESFREMLLCKTFTVYFSISLVRLLLLCIKVFLPDSCVNGLNFTVSVSSMSIVLSFSSMATALCANTILRVVQDTSDTHKSDKNIVTLLLIIVYVRVNFLDFFCLNDYFVHSLRHYVFRLYL